MPIPSDDILWSAIATVEQQLIPAMAEPLPRSLCFTLANMLRFVRVRLESEGQDLTNSIVEVRALLARSALPEALAALEREYRPAGTYPTLASLREELNALHRAIDMLLAKLRATREDDGLREDVLDHLRADHQRVGGWVQAAFTGLRR